MRKTIYVFFVMIIMMAVMAACSSNGNKDNEEVKDVDVKKEGYPIVDEEITMTMMGPGVGKAEWEDMPLLNEYAEKTNISFEYNTPPANDFGTNLNLALSSGDLEDIIFGPHDLTPGMEAEYGEQGLFLPLEDLIDDYAPNLKKLLEENPDIEKTITTPDGHIYALPGVSKDHRGQWMSPVWFNGKWLDELGVEELPETTDELYDLLIRFRDEDPNGNGEADEIPISSVEMEPIRNYFLNAFGLKDQELEEVDGKVRYAAITDNYKEYLEYMKKLYDEDLLDTETFSQSDDQKNSKGQENKIGMFADHYSYFTTGETSEEAMNNPMALPLKGPVSDELIVTAGPGFSRGTFVLTKENEYPEASIRWVDHFYSEEGGAEMDQGPEGYLWEWDENKEEKLPLDIPDEYDTSEDYRATITPAYGISPPMLNPPVEVKEQPDDFAIFTKEETEEKRDPYNEIAIPEVSLTSEERKEVETIEADLESYVEQMEAKFITGVEPLSNWDKYVSTIEDMNIEKYVEIYQEAYDRWLEN